MIRGIVPVLFFVSAFSESGGLLNAQPTSSNSSRNGEAPNIPSKTPALSSHVLTRGGRLAQDAHEHRSFNRAKLHSLLLT
jgi:hypothetical protein